MRFFFFFKSLVQILDLTFINSITLLGLIFLTEQEIRMVYPKPTVENKRVVFLPTVFAFLPFCRPNDHGSAVVERGVHEDCLKPL